MRTHLNILVERELFLFESPKYQNLPKSFWKNHMTSTFITTFSAYNSPGLSMPQMPWPLQYVMPIEAEYDKGLEDCLK